FGGPRGTAKAPRWNSSGASGVDGRLTSVNDAPGTCRQIARSSAVTVSQPYRNMYRPGSVTRPAFCHVTLLTTDRPSVPRFSQNHTTMIRRPEPADHKRVVYPVTMDPARGASATASVAFAARSPSVT